MRLLRHATNDNLQRDCFAKFARNDCHSSKESAGAVEFLAMTNKERNSQFIRLVEEKNEKNRSFWSSRSCLFFFTAQAATPECPELQIGLRRDFGYASGTGKIQGTFTISASGPHGFEAGDFLPGWATDGGGPASRHLRCASAPTPIAWASILFPPWATPAAGASCESNSISCGIRDRQRGLGGRAEDPGADVEPGLRCDAAHDRRDGVLFRSDGRRS